jgi:hypothetical protein
MNAPRRPATSIEKRLKAFIVWLVLIIGLLLVIVGIVYQAIASGSHLGTNAIASGVLISLGGGVLGAAIEDLLSRQDELDVLEHITRTAEASLRQIALKGSSSMDELRAVLRESLVSEIRSPDVTLEPFRRDWHHYHVTQSERELRWMYSIFPAASTRAINALTFKLELRDEQGELHSYDAEMFTRRDRLYVIYTQHAGTESSSTELFPQPGQYQRTLAGIGQRATWDRPELVAPVLMSKQPLIPGIEPGMVDPVYHAKLDEIWASVFPNLNTLHLTALAAPNRETGAVAPLTLMTENESGASPGELI